ncbi:MAG: tyrosine-type recombinase/integrase [Halioglobus sp.]
MPDPLRKEARLPTYRIHDLRHQASCMLVYSGRTLFEVQQVLGHADPRVTQRYAHMSTETMQDAANSIDDVLNRVGSQ